MNYLFISIKNIDPFEFLFEYQLCSLIASTLATLRSTTYQWAAFIGNNFFTIF